MNAGDLGAPSPAANIQANKAVQNPLARNKTMTKSNGLKNVDNYDTDEVDASSNRSFSKLEPLESAKKGVLKQPDKGMNLSRAKTNTSLNLSKVSKGSTIGSLSNSSRAYK